MIGNDRDGGKILINSGNDDLLFNNVVDIPCNVGIPVRQILVVDVDNDGLLDLIFGNEGTDNQVLINLGDGISFKEPKDPGSSWLPSN